MTTVYPITNPCFTSLDYLPLHVLLYQVVINLLSLFCQAPILSFFHFPLFLLSLLLCYLFLPLGVCSTPSALWTRVGSLLTVPMKRWCSVCGALGTAKVRGLPLSNGLSIVIILQFFLSDIFFVLLNLLFLFSFYSFTSFFYFFLL